LRRMWDLCRKNHVRAQRRHARQYNKDAKDVKYRCGQWVYLKNSLAKIGQAKKFRKPWIGPFEIIEVLSPVNVQLRLPNRTLLVHKNRLKPHPGSEVPCPSHPPMRRRGRPRKISIVGDADVVSAVPERNKHIPSPSFWEEDDAAIITPPLPQRTGGNIRGGSGETIENSSPNCEYFTDAPLNGAQSPFPRRPSPRVADRREPQSIAADSLSPARPDGAAPSAGDPEEEEEKGAAAPPRHPYALRSLGPPPALSPGASDSLPFPPRGPVR
jgi:hypothetical protein